MINSHIYQNQTDPKSYLKANRKKIFIKKFSLCKSVEMSSCDLFM